MPGIGVGSLLMDHVKDAGFERREDIGETDGLGVSRVDSNENILFNRSGQDRLCGADISVWYLELELVLIHLRIMNSQCVRQEC